MKNRKLKMLKLKEFRMKLNNRKKMKIKNVL